MAEFNPIDIQIDKSVLSVGFVDDEPDEKAYWWKLSPTERLIALEMSRRVIYGYVDPAPRLQRFFEVAEFKRS